MHGPQNSGGSNCNNHGNNKNNSLHYWRSCYVTGNALLTFPAFSPPLLSLANLCTIFDPHFTDGETKAQLKIL